MGSLMDRHRRSRRKLKRAIWFQRYATTPIVPCHYCGCPLSYREATVDHVLSLSRGGSNRLDNLVLSCRACNLRKEKSDASPAT